MKCKCSSGMEAVMEVALVNRIMSIESVAADLLGG